MRRSVRRTVQNYHLVGTAMLVSALPNDDKSHNVIYLLIYLVQPHWQIIQPVRPTLTIAWSKKMRTGLVLPLILSNLNRFVKFFHSMKEKEILNSGQITYFTTP